MKRRVLSMLLSMTMLCTACGAAGNSTNEQSGGETQDQAAQEASEDADGAAQTDTSANAQQDGASNTSATGKLPSLLGDEEEIYYDEALVPSVEPYEVAPDFSNVTYHPDYAYLFEPQYKSEWNDPTLLRDALVKNGFAIKKDSGHDEFYELYEDNRYFFFPNFVTVDSLMHTYHLYFAHLMKNTEKDYLADKLKELSAQMLAKSTEQYNALKGTKWESAALRNLEFFCIGAYLQDETVAAPVDDADFAAAVKAEIDKINGAEAIDDCVVSGLKEDYTQYKPRGYYEGDEQLEKYFKAMMWYGRIPMALDDEDMVRSACLISSALASDDEAWKSIYSVTSFFAGASDDPGYDQFCAVIEQCYGSVPDAATLSSDDTAFAKVFLAAKELDPPAVNSVPVMEGDDPVIPSFRFMGQRFTVDAAIMQKLIFSAVKENSNGDRRYLPDTLDTAAALGSDQAVAILKEQGAYEFENYEKNMSAATEHFNNEDPKIWNNSLYAGWLNTLRPLFESKGEGYPMFMQSAEWDKRNLECFAGSFAELKHDTILYSKSVMAEMGGGYDTPPDDRGYVDPEPKIYSRFIFLSNNTLKGLANLGMLSERDEDNLNRLSEIARRLLEISEKELKAESLSDDDYEWIRNYGGYIEHFWNEVNNPDESQEEVYPENVPCPVIADIATDPNGSILEVGTGYAQTMYVVFPIDGELHVGSGSVYSFYQFEAPMSDRMTDSEWRQILRGGYVDDNWEWVETEPAPDQPEWTQSYRVGN
ncbi:MAG: DUF3160 domain-containing protein [Butyrivibrio sp.]|nr:DUF3160 domain-containing protein [Butyrivibrio sp.]